MPLFGIRSLEVENRCSMNFFQIDGRKLIKYTVAKTRVRGEKLIFRDWLMRSEVTFVSSKIFQTLCIIFLACRRKGQVAQDVDSAGFVSNQFGNIWPGIPVSVNLSIL